MAKISKMGKKRGMQVVSTASLPDIVFMLLFFFMVTTVMRESEMRVEIVTPEATEAVKLENRSLVDYIYVGTPYDASKGSNPRIQLNGAIATPNQIQQFIEDERKKRPENLRSKIITALKVDQNTEMGLIGDIKIELRKANALKICYSTTEAMVAVN
jgi:biopolymer transport protein ExbD